MNTLYLNARAVAFKCVDLLLLSATEILTLGNCGTFEVVFINIQCVKKSYFLRVFL